MITVRDMFSFKIFLKCYNHDPQTFSKKVTDNITKHVIIKPYAQFILSGRWA